MRLVQVKCVLALVLAIVPSAFAEKKYRSQEEFELYSQVTKDFAANAFDRVLTGLDAWRQKFPDSDYAPNRQQLYVHAHSRSGQHAKAIQSAKPALAGPFDTPDDQLRLLYAVVMALQQIPEPAAELRQTATDAARQLIAFNQPPATMSATDWEKARVSLRTAANVALVHAALTPVRELMTAKDCAKAEASGLEVMREFPDSAQAAWVLASAQLCLARTEPSKFSSALYLLARAVAIDSTKGLVDPAWQSGTAAPYLEKIYTQYHGKDPAGLSELKSLAVNSPLPPEGFAITSAAEMEQRKQADLESKHPELALWLRIKAALEAPNGLSYFNSELKGVAVPQLKGKLLKASPECRPRELVLRLTTPEGGPEVMLKLDAQLSGKPAVGSDVQFEGVASEFTQQPFLLTMTVETRNITGVRIEPCAVPARPRRK